MITMLRMMMTALAVALAWPVLAAAAQGTEAAEVTVEESDEYGPYLTDADGQALYLFTADQQGSGDQAAQSNCYEACAEAWPPLVTDGEPQAGEQVDKSLIGTSERRNGQMQVTYGGWPLYYFVQDQGPGEATGQDKHGFGGEWYLVTPEGEKVEESS
jgi:predicted lipoprotein with Yx(FWY)xxD motif